MKGKNHWVLEVWVGIKVKLQYKTLILIQIARLDVIQKFQGSLITFCDLPFTKMGDISNIAIIAEINSHYKSCEIHKHKALNRRCIPYQSTNFCPTCMPKISLVFIAVSQNCGTPFSVTFKYHKTSISLRIWTP
jgi:hypothetical protein